MITVDEDIEKTAEMGEAGRQEDMGEMSGDQGKMAKGMDEKIEQAAEKGEAGPQEDKGIM